MTKLFLDGPRYDTITCVFKLRETSGERMYSVCVSYIFSFSFVPSVFVLQKRSSLFETHPEDLLDDYIKRLWSVSKLVH